MLSEPSAPIRPRGGRRLIIAGSIIIAVALLVGVTSGVVVAMSVGGPLSEALTSPSRPTPVDEQLSLEAGRYTVFELVGHQSSEGPVTTFRRDAPTLGPEMVDVTGPDGDTVTVSGFTSSSESLTRGEDIYAGVARFVVAEPGQYRVRIDAPAGKQVLIVPSFGSGFGAVLTWVLAGIASFVALVVGVTLIIVGAIRGRRRPTGRATSPVHHTGPPEGWYSAPDVANRERYWDGRAWTEHLR
jgi:hypothetical protein